MQREEMLAYEFDASGIKGRAKDVFFPKSIEEVQEIIKNESKICIRGGGTGFVGGAVPQNNQDTVLDLSQLTKISEIDLDRKTVVVEAGVILDDLQNYLKKFNLEFPIKPLSYETCTIGGMIATNAIDSRIIKYKKTENWVRWIEVIDGDGKIDRKGRTEISDYSGMEGISGVIIKACLNLVKIVKIRTATLIKINNKNKILEIVKLAKHTNNVSIVDFIDKKISVGVGLTDAYHLIVEYENDSGILKGSEYLELMKKKNKIFKFLVSEGYTRIEDPKIMIDKFIEVLEWLEKRSIPVYSNISVGIIYPQFYKGQEIYIPEFYKMIKKSGGKISGSHGIGIRKKEFVEPNDKKIIENIKKRTDPLNKFNIGKVI